MDDTFIVFRQFQDSGPWIVQLLGANRPNKIAYVGTKQEAEDIAHALNDYLFTVCFEQDQEQQETAGQNIKLQEECETLRKALRDYGAHLSSCKYSHCPANRCTCGLYEFLNKQERD